MFKYYKLNVLGLLIIITIMIKRKNRMCIKKNYVARLAQE
jgi:hypothetical protein